jgi:PKD domain-containing protein
MMRRLLSVAVVVFACTSTLATTNAMAQMPTSHAAANVRAVAASGPANSSDVNSGPGPVGVGVGGDGGGGTVDGTGNQDGGAGNGGDHGGGTNSCVGCTYRWVAICDPALANAGCANACPAGFLMETLMITDPRLPAAIAGATECRSPSGATPAQVQLAASDQFSQLLTTAHPSQQPAGGGVVNLPTLFATNTPTTQTFNETLLGVQVTLNVDASWTWDFGDGATLTSTDPGGPYPITSLRHVYLVAGAYTVTLTTNWTGTFSMAGGPAAVIPGGPIPRVSDPVALDIHEAHSVLITG